MRSQTLRLALLIALGALLALLILRPWQSSEQPPAPVVREPAPVAQPPARAAPARTFNVVIAYDESGVAASKIEWRKGAAVIDVPWSAAQIAYGVNFHGSGKMYVDDTHLNVLDRGIPVRTHNLPSKLGVVVQDESGDGPLPMPSNLDFEEVTQADQTFREQPKDRLDRSRF